MASFESYKTTAAEAQHDADPRAAKTIQKFAATQQQAAKDASQVAQEAGSKLTGNPEGDADAQKVKDSLTSTRITGAEVYSTDTSQPTINHGMPSVLHAADSAKKKTGDTYQSAKDTVSSTVQATEDGAMGIVGTAQNTVNSAINKTGETLASTRDAAANTASGAYQYTKDTANAAVKTTGETYQSTKDAAFGKADDTYQYSKGAADTAANKTGESYQATKGSAQATKDSAVSESKGILSSITDTASAALTGAGGYVQAAADTATGAASKVVETAQGYMGMGNNKPGEDVRKGMDSGAGEEQFSRGAIPPSSAVLESGPHDVKNPYNDTTKIGKDIGANVGNPPKALS